jgi:uncharacterized protein (TIGR03435 family)
MTNSPSKDMLNQFPKWTIDDRFDIQARAIGNPSKDQMRLMLQSLFADRFKIKIHYEQRQMPVFALVLAKPGRTGPQLLMHSSETPCSSGMSPQAPAVTRTAAPEVGEEFPVACGGVIPLAAKISGDARAAARNVPIGVIAGAVSYMGDVDRPVIANTGLRGNFDFNLEWNPDPTRTDSGINLGPSLQDALREQLGLKLEPQTGPVEYLVLDHIEPLSPN